MNNFSLHLRRLPLQGTHNTRDLGGYPCPLGVTHFGVFLRSDSPHELTPQDVNDLYAYGIRNSVDLRSEEERLKEPSVFESNSHFQASWVSLSDVLETADYEGDTPGSMSGLYISLLDHCGAQIADIIRIFSKAEGGTFFHCAVGKDRTGVVSMLLLALVGVCEKDIVADYAVSEIYLHKVFSPALQSAQQTGQTEDQYAYRGYSRPKSMWRALQHLNEVYGGAEAYLTSLGLFTEELNALRQKFVSS